MENAFARRERGCELKHSNLISNIERTPGELREMGRKGGIKSGEARRKKRDAIKRAQLWMRVFDELERKDKAGAERVIAELMKGWSR